MRARSKNFKKEKVPQMKYCFIVNPKAGKGQSVDSVCADVKRICEEREVDYDLFISECIGDTKDHVAKLAAEGSEVCFIACGGDGTLNEVVSGLLAGGHTTPVGYIPAGSTNDFAASLKLPNNIMQAAQDILEGQPITYDVGKFGDRYFCYVASFGAFTKTSYAMPQSVKNALGHTAYVLGGISELSQIRNEHIRMEIDGEVVEDDFLFGAICNSTSIGGILTLPPNRVDMGDGVFEVMLIRAPRNLTELTECILSVQSQSYNCGMITFRSARSIRVTADPNMPWTLDGERSDGAAQIAVKNLHHAIRLMRKG